MSDRSVAVNRNEFMTLVRETVSAGGSAWIHVRGASMLPAIPRGSEIRVDPLPAGGARRGDVVLASAMNGSPVAHRVWAALGERVWLKGDFRVTPDSPIRRADIIGLVSMVSSDGAVVAIPRRASRAPRDVARRWRAFAKDVLRGA